MSTAIAATQRTGLGVWGLGALFVFLLAYGVAIFFFQELAVAGLIGLFAFLVFLQYPALGLYTTVGLLLLQGSAGVLTIVTEQAPIAITVAQLSGAAALAAWLLRTLTRKMPFYINAPVVLAGAFIAWMLLGTVLSPDTAEQMPHFARLAVRFGLFLLAVNLLTTARAMHWYLAVLVLATATMAGVAVLQYFVPQYQVAGAEAWGLEGLTDAAYIDPESLEGEPAIRVSGRAGHSTWLATIILLVLPLHLYWLAITKDTRLKAFLLVAIAIALTALVLTFTRTGLVVGIVLGALLLYKRFYSLSPLKVFGFLAVISLSWLVLPGAYKERVLSPQQYTQSESVQSRLDMQQKGIQYALDAPLLGHGAGGFGIHYIEENSESAQVMASMVRYAGWEPVFVGVHNMYLEIASDTGFIGLALMLAFLAVVISGVMRQEQAYKAAGDRWGAALASSLWVSLVAFVVIAVFLHALHREIWWMVAAAAVALALHKPDFRAGLGRLPFSKEVPRPQ